MLADLKEKSAHTCWYAMMSIISEEPKVGVVSKNKKTERQAATHLLNIPNKHHQQVSNTLRYGNHPPTGESRTGIISRLKKQ